MFTDLEFARERQTIAELFQANPSIDEPDVLAALLDQIDPDEDLSAFNAALRGAGIPFAIEKRKLA